MSPPPVIASLHVSFLRAAIGLSIKLPEERLSVINWAGALSPPLSSGSRWRSSPHFSQAYLQKEAAGFSETSLGLAPGLSLGVHVIMLRTTSMNNAPPPSCFSHSSSWRCDHLRHRVYHRTNDVYNSLVGWSSLLFREAVIVSYTQLPRLELPLEAIPRGAPPEVLVFMTPIFGVILSQVTPSLENQFKHAPFVFGRFSLFAGLLLIQANNSAG